MRRAMQRVSTIRLFPAKLAAPGRMRGFGRVWAAGHGPEAVRATVGNRATAVVRDTWGRWRSGTGAPATGSGLRPGWREEAAGFLRGPESARRLRDAVPLVVDDCDRIVWVAGHGIDEAFRVTDPTQAVIILQLRPV